MWVSDKSEDINIWSADTLIGYNVRSDDIVMEAI